MLTHSHYRNNVFFWIDHLHPHLYQCQLVLMVAHYGCLYWGQWMQLGNGFPHANAGSKGQQRGVWFLYHLEQGKQHCSWVNQTPPLRVPEGKVLTSWYSTWFYHSFESWVYCPWDLWHICTIQRALGHESRPVLTPSTIPQHGYAFC